MLYDTVIKKYHSKTKNCVQGYKQDFRNTEVTPLEDIFDKPPDFSHLVIHLTVQLCFVCIHDDVSDVLHSFSHC